jgi:Tol biopolymer transport system component
MCQTNPTVLAFDICTADLDGANMRQLTRQPAHTQALFPAWSPDGARLTYEVRPDEESDASDIYSMNADGSGQTNLTRHSEWRNRGATWSPDGATILFDSMRNTDYSGNPRNLYVMCPDGSGVRRLLASQWGESGDWSPDGARIVFMSAAWPTPPSLNGSARPWDDQPQRALRDTIQLGMDIPGKYLEFNLYVMNADGTGV